MTLQCKRMICRKKSSLERPGVELHTRRHPTFGVYLALECMPKFRHWLESTITSAILVFGTFGAIALTTKIFGDYCWPPRFGGILVGLAVFVQAYVYANNDYFSQLSKYGLTREQRVLHMVYVVAIFGTMLWALGDFLHSIDGVAVCVGV